MITSLLVANRGEIACRIFQTCERLGIEKLAVYSDADADAKHVRMSDRASHIGESPAAASYLNSEAVMEAAEALGADAVHPGYGFLSENSEFARQVVKNGMIWVGPDPDSMDLMSDKIDARAIMRAAGVPVVPGSTGEVSELQTAIEEASRIGYPAILKASAGGGGIGMTVVSSAEGLEAAFDNARSKATRFFSNPTVYLEKYIPSARHIEVQMLGLNSGRMVVMGDRDCTVQRRHQKVLEEAPCPDLSPEERSVLHESARAAAAKVNYRGAGTIEMILDLADRSMYFLEMNTRLQVEHPVTELVTGVDLVEAQIRIAQGEDLDDDFPQDPTAQGHAIEFRIYAEDPDKFLPGPGVITEWEQPAGEGIRVDGGYEAGDTVTPHYDPLMAKLCVHARDRGAAITRLVQASASFRVVGPKNNLAVAGRVLTDERFQNCGHDTTILQNPKH